MKLTLILAGLLAMPVLSAPALATDGRALAQKNNCLACHAIDKKAVGPAFKDVAKRYAGVKGAEDQLVRVVKNGSTPGKLNWGAVPMPANNAVKEEEIRTVVKWILMQK